MGLFRNLFLTPILVAGAIAGLTPAYAEDAPRSPEPPPAPEAKAKKPMKMDQPMAGGMMKEGMMKGDMKKAAEKKERVMDEAMKQEEKATGAPK